MWLGIDLGTSSVKAVLVDDAGALMAEARAPLAISRPNAGWSEQNPDDWWLGVQTAVTALPANARAKVRGVGLSGQMHGAVLLGADDRPLRPAILWNDGRAAAQCATLEARVPAARTITGNRAMPGFTAPKLIWLAKHEPDVFARTKKVLLPKDYVRLMLTGDHASDLSDSAGTLWLDVAKRCWSAEMLAACRLNIHHMPQLFEGIEATGRVRADIAAALGIPAVPVAAGGGDNAAGAVGIGALSPGGGFVSLGTSGVVFVVGDGCAPAPERAVHAFCHALPGRWHQMAVILSAASALDWIVGVTGFADAGSALAAAQTHGAATATPIFLPYLSGERTPHDDAAARGVLFGLSHGSDRGALVQAVIEGVAFALADGVDAIRAAGSPAERLTLIGGGARSTWWAQIIASATGLTLDLPEGAQVGPALGAARLARLAATGEAIDVVCTAPALRTTILPDKHLAERLAPRLALYRELYSDLRKRFKELL
jgi:xylulokinase